MSSDTPFDLARRWIVGRDVKDLRQLLVERYLNGDSIRTLSRITGRSYGWVHTQLIQADIPLRSRGGANNLKKDTSETENQGGFHEN